MDPLEIATRFKCPQEGCPVYLFEDTREVMMEALKEDTHPQVRARLQREMLKCKCGFTPKMKLSRTTKNYNKVFLSCGSFLPGHEPCGYFQWIHGPLWYPREPGQPSLRRWVKDTPPENAPRRRWSDGHVPVPLLKKHCLDTGKEEKDDGPLPRERLHGKAPWLNQFAKSVAAQNREFERRRQEFESKRHLHKSFGSGVLF